MEFRDILQTSNPFYQFQQTIGEGGQGMVCKAINDKGENFAIKIRKVNSHNQNSCLREVKANARLRNTPGIVHFYESFVESDGPNIFLYLVFEFVEGKDLLQMMQDRDCGPMSEEQAREIFQQLVQAVKTCHKNGIVHRDLKPENIIIDYEGQVKLIDFGLCQMDASGRMCDDRTCTLQYSSPEMISEKFYDGELADVWSLGNILYILLTGVIPFSKEEKKKFKEGQQKHPILEWPSTDEIPYQISNESKDLVERMLDMNPKRRIKIEQIQQHKWIKKSRNSMNAMS